MALPRASPAMKLERIKAADQTEFPKAKPLSRSQRVWKRSALLPERKRIAETIATRTSQSLRCSPPRMHLVNPGKLDYNSSRNSNCFERRLYSSGQGRR